MAGVQDLLPGNPRITLVSLSLGIAIFYTLYIAQPAYAYPLETLNAASFALCVLVAGTAAVDDLINSSHGRSWSRSQRTSRASHASTTDLIRRQRRWIKWLHNVEVQLCLLLFQETLHLGFVALSFLSLYQFPHSPTSIQSHHLSEMSFVDPHSRLNPSHFPERKGTLPTRTKAHQHTSSYTAGIPTSPTELQDLLPLLLGLTQILFLSVQMCALGILIHEIRTSRFALYSYPILDKSGTNVIGHTRVSSASIAGSISNAHPIDRSLAGILEADIRDLIRIRRESYAMGDGYGYRQWRGCTCSQPVLQQQREKQSGSGHEATSRPSQSPRRSNGYDHRHRHSDARCPGCSSTSTSFGFGSGSSKTNGLGSPYEYARNTRRHSKLENQLRLGQEEKAGTPRRRSRTTSANSTGSDSISGGSSISVSPTTPYTSFGRASASVQAPGHMRHSSGSSGLGAIYEHSRGHLSSQGHLREADMKDVGTAYDSRNTLDDPERGIRFSDPFPPRRRRVSPSSASHSTDLTTLGQGDAGIGTGKTATGTGMTRGDRRARLSVRFNLDHAVLNVNNANPADPCCQDYTRTALKPVSTCGTGSGRSSALGSGRVITPDWLNRSDHIHTNSDANAKGRPHGIEVNYFSFSAMDNDQSPNDDGQVMTQLQSLPLPTKSTEEMTWPISPEEATHGSPSLLPTPLPTPIPGSNTYVGALAGTGAGGSSVAVTSGNVIGHRIEHAWMDVRGDSESDSIVTR